MGRTMSTSLAVARGLLRAIASGRSAFALSLAFGFVFVVALLTVASPAGAASGDLVWQRAYSNGANAIDFFTALAPAPGGGVFAVGTSLAGTNAIVAARYDVAGQLGWRHTFTDVANGTNEAVSAISDGQGDLIVGGYVSSAANVLNPVIIEYGPHGNLRWMHIGTGQATNTDDLSLATNARGDIFAAFGVKRSASNDIVITRYARSGKRRWTRLYTSAGSNSETGMALDAAGNVYVTGAEDRGSQHDLDVLTLKYDSSGHRRWVRFWDGSGLPDVGYAVAVAGKGTLYVGGYTTGAQSGDDALLLEYSSRGALRWSRTYTGAGANTDYYEHVVALGDGSVAAAGGSATSTAGDVVVARYARSGARRWLRLYGGPDGLGGQASSLARGVGGAIYVAGDVTTAATAEDSLLLKYGKTGALLWARSHTSPGMANDYALALAVVAGRSVYVAGGQNASPGAGDGMLLRYRP
jgi:hypothetical protein